MYTYCISYLSNLYISTSSYASMDNKRLQFYSYQTFVKISTIKSRNFSRTREMMLFMNYTKNY